MQNDTWVCFDCRIAVRRPAGTLNNGQSSAIGRPEASVRCPECGEPCRYLGHKTEVPRKQAFKAWNKLMIQVQDERLRSRDERAVADVRWKHSRERATRKWLDDLTSRPPNAQRARIIAELRRQMT